MRKHPPSPATVEVPEEEPPAPQVPKNYRYKIYFTATTWRECTAEGHQGTTGGTWLIRDNEYVLWIPDTMLWERIKLVE